MEARDKKILIQSVSAVLIIVVLFNVYSGITVSKIGIPGLLEIVFNPDNKNGGDDGPATEQKDTVRPGSTTTNEWEQGNEGSPIADDDIGRDTFDDIEQLEDTGDIYRPVQPEPTQPAFVDLNGTWYGDDGSEYEISQTGSSVFFTEYGLFGETARGSGSYQNNKLVFEYETVFGTFGRATLNVSQNGRVLRGRANDMTSGVSTQLHLTRY